MNRKNRLVAVVLVALALVLGGTASAEEPGTIRDIAAGNPAFSTLAMAAMKAGVLDFLDGNRTLTVFAPTNDAFDAAAAELLDPSMDGVDLVSLLSPKELKSILLYHVSPGERLAADVVGARQIRMLNKQFTRPSLDGDSVFLNDSLITDVDIEASNGVVHIIDFPLLPE
jgi:uncharacterized surface protein with fasciclin (FAS1) repeats